MMTCAGKATNAVTVKKPVSVLLAATQLAELVERDGGGHQACRLGAQNAPAQAHGHYTAASSEIHFMRREPTLGANEDVDFGVVSGFPMAPQYIADASGLFLLPGDE
jgi:hypothetical protein